MSTEKIIDSLFDNNLEAFRNQVHTSLYVKAGEYMNSAKQVVAGGMFNPPQEVQEELKGNQKKLDLATPKGKLTAADFAALRKKG